MFYFNMNFPHYMPKVICFPNACAALVAEIASQSPQATLLASCPCTAMMCLRRPPTLEIRPEKQKIRLNSDPFVTKNQTKFRLIWE